MIELPPSLDQLEQNWATVARDLQAIKGQILPFNGNGLLKPLRLKIRLLHETQQQRHNTRAGKQQDTYTPEGILTAWNKLLKLPDKQSDPTILRILIKQIVTLPVMPLVAEPAVLALIDNHPDIFVSKPWLRRFYYFFFDSLYQQQPDTVLQPWAKLIFRIARAFSGIRMRPRYQTLLATAASYFSADSGFLADRFEAYLADLLKRAPESATQTIESLEAYYREALGFDSLPQGIRLYCQRHLFGLYLARYLDNPNDTALLTTLLQQFCSLEQSVGREHFLRLVTEAYGNSEALRGVASPLKACIKIFLLETIGDPRLNGPAWLSFKDQALEIYKELRYWFMEADFEFFFNFAFKDSPDEHGRRELWMKFLRQAHDFRVFLPAYSYREFQKTVTDANKAAQVYKNAEDITGFILCISDLVIYEVVETRNAAYIFHLPTLNTDTSWQSQSVQRFFKTLFNENTNPNTGTKSALAHTLLASAQHEQIYTPRRKNRRFTHDALRNWHQQVLDFLRIEHLIYPDPPEPKKRKP